jgi:type I restriction-modification system DNA methylase subunit
MKGPGTNLDRPQARPDPISPVDQAFRNSNEFDGCRWVIVSNFSEIRVYSRLRGKHRFQEFSVQGLAEDQQLLRNFYALFALQFFINEEGPSRTDDLAVQTWRQQEAITQAFYDEYRNRREELFHELVDQNQEDPAALVQAAQQLIDRILFLHFCVDRGLMPPTSVRQVRETPASDSFAWRPSGLWDALRGLFRAVDGGHAGSGIPAYNGGLFRQSLLDRLRLDEAPGAQYFVLRMLLGWDDYDFQSQLDVDVLGHVFEQSIVDLDALRQQALAFAVRPAAGAEHRREQGIFYTPDWVTSYMVGRALAEFTQYPLAENRDVILLDPACGSGAFLTQALRQLLEMDAPRVPRASNEQLAGTPLFDDADYQFAVRALEVLRGSILGIDLSAESTEITKLSLWLQTAHPRISLLDLDHNILWGNSLCENGRHVDHHGIDLALSFPAVARRQVDIVIGNPPWGADLSAYSDCVEGSFELAEGQYDSYEVFLERAFRMAREPTINGGGPVVAFVIPDSIFLPEHERTRAFISRNHTILEIIRLGEGVFEGVYRGAVILVCRKGPAGADHRLRALTIRKDDREQITDVGAAVNVDMLMAERGHEIAQRRFIEDERCRWEIFAGELDFALMDRMRQNTIHWRALMETGRGVEIGAAGEVLRCPNCMNWANYPRERAARRGGGYYPKTCEHCEFTFPLEQALATDRIIHDPADLYLDQNPENIRLRDNERWLAVGESVERYRLSNLRIIRIDHEGINYKTDAEYRSPKLLFRKTGVGIWASINYNHLYTTQVVYHYRLRDGQPQNKPYRLEYFLGVMNSRLMLYFYYKSTGNVEWRSFPYITQRTIEEMPVREIDFANHRQRDLHNAIAEKVEQMLRTPGDQDLDLGIERDVMDLYEISPAERAHVFGVLKQVQRLRIIREMVPQDGEG